MEHTSVETLHKCPVCGSSSSTVWNEVTDYSISGESFDLVDCVRCGFRYTNPRPHQNQLGRYYESDDYISHSNSSRTVKDKLYQLARKRALKKKFKIIHRIQPHGRVLDIGCGTGEFLGYLMSRGYIVNGVEPSLQAREKGIAEHAISVVPSLDAIPALEQFQVITMWHVLEHVPDVRETFKRLHSLLATGGLLVIAVPDRGSWDAEHYMTHWAALDVPRHLSHFRQKDIHTLLEEHGFERSKTRRMWLDALYIAMLSERYCGHSSPIDLIKGILIGIWSNLQSIITKRPTSSSLYLSKKAEA